MLFFLFTDKGNERQSLVEFITHYLQGNKEAEQKLFRYVSDLIEKGMIAIENKGSYFRQREDVKQEILAAILVENDKRILRKFKGNSRLSTYLWSVIKFKLIDALRREMNIHECRIELTEDIIDNSGSENELNGLIDRFIDQCNEKDAFILRRRWKEGLDYETICKESDGIYNRIDKIYIGNLLFKMRRNLIRFLKNEGYPIDIQV